MHECGGEILVPTQGKLLFTVLSFNWGGRT